MPIESTRRDDIKSILEEQIIETLSELLGETNAKKAIADRDSLHELALLSQTKVPGLSSKNSKILKAAFQLAALLNQEKLKEQPQLNWSCKTRFFLREEFRFEETEKLRVLLLDGARKFLKSFEIASGGLEEVAANPGLIFRPAILYNAQYIVLAHNHPSGPPTPSERDLETHKRLLKAGEALGILLDENLIFSRPYASNPDYYSFLENGLI